jgi:hypothetical protein
MSKAEKTPPVLEGAPLSEEETVVRAHTEAAAAADRRLLHQLSMSAARSDTMAGVQRMCAVLTTALLCGVSWLSPFARWCGCCSARTRCSLPFLVLLCSSSSPPPLRCAASAWPPSARRTRIASHSTTCTTSRCSDSSEVPKQCTEAPQKRCCSYRCFMCWAALLLGLVAGIACSAFAVTLD